MTLEHKTSYTLVTPYETFQHRPKHWSFFRNSQDSVSDKNPLRNYFKGR